MTRLPFSSPLRFSHFGFRFRLGSRVSSRLALGAVLLGAVCGAQTARADEFSIVPLGDPIYAQISGLSRARTPEPSEAKVGTLTRYEAALQAARAILDIQNRAPKTVTKANWRAIKGLCGSLKSELKQLGVDVDATLTLADRSLKSADLTPAASPSASSSSSVSLARSGLSIPNSSNGSLAPVSTGLSSPGLMLGTPSLGNRAVKTSVLEIPLLQRLRSETSLLARQDATASTALTGNAATLAGNAAALDAALSPQELAAISAKNGLTNTLGSQTSLALDFGDYLTFRAATSQRRLGVAGDDSQFLLGQFLDGATRSSATGGGLGVNMGALKISTDIEKLRTDTGANASRFGGSASLSGWQNRFSLNANLSRLTPDNKSILPSTAAQFGVGVGVTQNLRLNLLIQSLFAQTPQNSASRVSGGVSLSF